MTKTFVNVKWDKVDEKVKLSGSNYTRLSEEAGLNRSYFHKARTGMIKCNEEYFRRLCKILNIIPSYYILTDEEEKINKKPDDNVNEKVPLASELLLPISTGLTSDEQEKLSNLCKSSEEFRKALKHFTEDHDQPVTIPDPIVTSAANRKWLRNLEKETNEILNRGILKDTNAAVHYAYYKITHSYISNSIDKMEIRPTSDGAISIRFKEENHGNSN